MQNKNQKMAFGLLLAGSAMAVHAQPKAPEATLPVKAAATQQSTPIDLALHPAAAPLSTPIDLALPPAATPQSLPIDLAMPPVAAPLSTPTGLALNPATAVQLSPFDLALQSASAEVKRVARWVVDSGDNTRLPFLLVDKVNARVFAFNPAGQLQGAAPVLLGMERGDRLLAANNAPMGSITPEKRITPAGRFVSRLAIDSHGKELLVLDYDASISLHAVVKGKPAERRAERLNSATSQDNRISFGCINVPTTFYSTIVSPAFTGTKGVVYVLPETSSATAMFGMLPLGAAVTGAQQSPPALNARASQTVPVVLPPPVSAPDAR